MKESDGEKLSEESDVEAYKTLITPPVTRKVKAKREPTVTIEEVATSQKAKEENKDTDSMFDKSEENKEDMDKLQEEADADAKLALDN